MSSLNLQTTPVPVVTTVVNPKPYVVSVAGPIYVTGGSTAGVSSLALTSPMSAGFALSANTGAVSVGFNNVGVTPANVFLRGDGAWATPSGSGLSIQVDGNNVPPLAGAINFTDSAAQYNRVLFSNPSFNTIRADLDVTSPIITTELTINNLSGSAGVTLDYPDNATNSYDLFFPPVKPLANQIQVFNLDGTSSWQAYGGGSATTPGGANTQVQFNNNGVFGGAAGLTWDGTTLGTNVVGALSTSTLSLRSSTGVRLGDNFANFVSMTGNASGLFPSISSAGLDPNIDLVIFGKGTGGLQLGTLANATPLIVADSATPTTLTPGVSGMVLTSAGPGKTPFWQVPSGGGGGGTFTTTTIWTGGTATKDAFTSPGVPNTQGITINLIASTGSGQITNARVGLNGVLLTNSYTSTGTWPNLTIVVPSVDLAGNAAETASSVTVSVTGVFNTSNFNIVNAGTLMNNQPVAFTTNLTGSYSISSAPFYTTTASINYAYTNTNAITSFGGVFTPGGNATSPSGTFNNVAITGSTISGSATGNGLFGAGSSTVNLSGSVAAVPTFVPAFYAQTANSTPPVFTSASTQTSRAATGSTIVYPSATASTQYDWLCTQRPLANIFISTSFGNVAFVPDVTAPTQTIAGQVFSVYGISNLIVSQAITLVIT